MKALKELVRPTIWALKPYSSARDEYKGVEASVFLDANENPYNMPFNRYPDPLQQDVKNLLAPIKGVRQDQIFLGNGSDEAIDVLFRVFCEPAIDNVVAIAPTYGMYEVCADINNIAYRTVLLDASYGLNAQMILEAVDRHTKMLFLCSPNNPSGNDLDRDEMIRLIENFDGIIVIDEAYSDFSAQRPFRLDLDKYPNIVVLNTFSKAWGCAAIRLGMAFASPDIIAMMNKVKYPYNVNLLTQQAAISILENYKEVEAWIQKLCETRTKLMDGFSQLPCCEFLYPSNANFFLAKMTDACGIYDYLVRHGIIVRNRHHVVLCGNCLRITIGTDDENEILLDALKQYNG